MSIRVCNIIVHPKHLSAHLIIFVLFPTPSEVAVATMLPPDHPTSLMLTRLDDTTHPCSSCSICDSVLSHISTCLRFQLIVISASVLMTTLAPHGRMVLSFPP